MKQHHQPQIILFWYLISLLAGILSQKPGCLKNITLCKLLQEKEQQ